MHLLSEIAFIALIVIASVVYNKAGMGVFDAATAGVLIGGGILLLFWIGRIIKPIIPVLREIASDDMTASDWPRQTAPETIEELKIAAAARIESGESADAIIDDLCRDSASQRSVVAPIVQILFQARQSRYRQKGILWVAIGGILLVTPFVLQVIMGELISGVNPWSSHRIGGNVHWAKLSLWALALYFALKGLARIILGGAGIQTKRPS